MKALQLMRFIRRWHARFGVMAALFFVILTITGVMLNHTESLALDKTQVQTGWLMRWYGLHARIPQSGYRFPNGYFTAQGGVWVMDGRVIGRDRPDPVGAVQSGGLRFLASPNGIAIYQPNGQQVDRLDDSVLPATPIQALGLSRGRVVLRTAKGLFASGDGGMDWSPLRGGVHWSVATPLPADTREQLNRLLAPALPLERVVLDLHSGRLFGRYGPYLMDLAAVILLILSLSGLWIYLQNGKRP